LHYALDYPVSRVAIATKSTAEAAAAAVLVQEARNVVVTELVNRFPQSLETVDPVTKLYPFQLAAMNPLISLDTVNLLLRMCPGSSRCGSCDKTNKL
jgi:hypothetical protein